MSRGQTFESERKRDYGKTPQEIQVRDIKRGNNQRRKIGEKRMDEVDKSHVVSGEENMGNCGVCGQNNQADVYSYYVDTGELPAVAVKTRIGRTMFQNVADDLIEENDITMRKVGVCGQCLQKLRSKESRLNGKFFNGYEEEDKIRLVISPG